MPTTPDPAKAADAVDQYLRSKLGQFDPWEDAKGRSPQRDFIRAAETSRVRLFRAGNQAGKTTIGAVDAALRVLNWHPFARKPKNGKGHAWLIALDWEFGVGEVLWPKFREYIPSDMIAQVVWYRAREPSIPRSILLTNGWRVDFKSADAKRKKFQGATLDFAWIDEECPSDIAQEVRARLVKKGGDLNVTLTPIRREKWVVDLEREAGTHVTRASMTQAAQSGILSLEAVEAYLDSLPERWRKVRDDGEFAALDGLVYPEFFSPIHEVRPHNGRLVSEHCGDVAPYPIPAGWPRFASIDFGYSHPTAVIIAAVDPGSGAVFIEKVWYAAFIRASKWGEMLANSATGLPPLAFPLIADHDASERAELRAKGVESRRAQKDIVLGLECMEGYLAINEESGRPSLFVCMHDENPPRHPDVGPLDGREWVNEILGYRYPEDKESASQHAKDLPLKKDDHAMDATRYLLYFLGKRWGRMDPPKLTGRRKTDRPSRRKVIRRKRGGRVFGN